MIFPGVFISRYIFPGGKLARLTSWGWETEYFFQVLFFSEGSNHLGFNFQGIYESNNNFFQGVFVFKNLVVHTPV